MTTTVPEVTHQINIVNRDEFPLFVPTPQEHFKVKRRITSVQVKKVSFDELYAKLKAEGRQIDIRSPEIFVDGRKPMDGIFSPLFGADSTKDTPVYTCDCGELTGGSNKGRLCKKCNSTCRTIEADLRLLGFIDIAPYHIITDLGMVAMKRAVKNLKEVLGTVQRIGRSGAVVKSDIPTIMDLYDDYDILYRNKAKEEKRYAFTSKIPVYSSRLRPLIQDRSRLSILDVNKHYLAIASCAQIIRDETIIPSRTSEIKIQRTLNEIQEHFNEIMGIVDSQINKKKGVFRHSLASGSLDYSFRLVITLGPDLMAHEVDVPYHTMMVGCEEEIVRRLVDMDDIPVAKAIAKVEKHMLHPHPKFMKIINMILRSGVGVWTLINRNPTISKYGIGYFRIRKIHEDPDDFTLHLPVDVLREFGADFDGDQQTLVMVKFLAKYHPLFQSICPTYWFINRTDGRFNRSMGFEKDYAALLSEAWDIDTAYDEATNREPGCRDKLDKLLGKDGYYSPEEVAHRQALFNFLWDPTISDDWKDRYGGNPAKFLLPADPPYFNVR